MNDVDYLRAVFAPLDPAREHGAPVRSAPAEGPAAELRAVQGTSPAPVGRRWLIPALVAAAVAAVVLLVTVVRPSLGPAPAPAAPPTARAVYDHVSWQVWVDGRLTERGQRWFDGVDGRVLVTGADGSALRDQRVQIPGAAGSTPSRSAPAATGSFAPDPTASPGATFGGQAVVEADEFPGTIPQTRAALRSYLGDPDAGSLGRRIASLVFARTLSRDQQRELAAIASSLNTSRGTVRSPLGTELIAVTVPSDGDPLRLLLDGDGSAVRGVLEPAAGQQHWRLLVGSDTQVTTGR